MVACLALMLRSSRGSHNTALFCVHPEDKHLTQISFQPSSISPSFSYADLVSSIQAAAGASTDSSCATDLTDDGEGLSPFLRALDLVSEYDREYSPTSEPEQLSIDSFDSATGSTPFDRSDEIFPGAHRGDAGALPIGNMAYVPAYTSLHNETFRRTYQQHSRIFGHHTPRFNTGVYHDYRGLYTRDPSSALLEPNRYRGYIKAGGYGEFKPKLDYDNGHSDQRSAIAMRDSYQPYYKNQTEPELITGATENHRLFCNSEFLGAFDHCETFDYGLVQMIAREVLLKRCNIDPELAATANRVFTASQQPPAEPSSLTINDGVFSRSANDFLGILANFP